MSAYICTYIYKNNTTHKGRAARIMATEPSIPARVGLWRAFVCMYVYTCVSVYVCVRIHVRVYRPAYMCAKPCDPHTAAAWIPSHR